MIELLDPALHRTDMYDEVTGKSLATIRALDISERCPRDTDELLGDDGPRLTALRYVHNSSNLIVECLRGYPNKGATGATLHYRIGSLDKPDALRHLHRFSGFDGTPEEFRSLILEYAPDVTALVATDA